MLNTYDILKLGMVLDFDGKDGIICHKKNLDGNIYANVCFDEEDEKNKYIIFKVLDDNDNIKFVEEKDEKVINNLMSFWVAEDLVEFENEQE